MTIMYGRGGKPILMTPRGPNAPKVVVIPETYSIVAALYSQLATIARQYGYSLLTAENNDPFGFELFMTPWEKDPKPPEEFIKQITTDFVIRQAGFPVERLHGQKEWRLYAIREENIFNIIFLPTQE